MHSAARFALRTVDEHIHAHQVVLNEARGFPEHPLRRAPPSLSATTAMMAPQSWTPEPDKVSGTDNEQEHINGS
jgi:hypothetical protein